MDKLREFISNSGGRRFLMVVSNAIVSSILLINGYISQEIYRDLIVATTAVYIAANTTQKFKKPILGDDNG